MDPEKKKDADNGEKKPLKPDAVAEDGVLSLLKAGLPGSSDGTAVGGTDRSRTNGGAGIPRRLRSLSSGTLEQLDSQDRQLRFNENRRNLGRYLGDTIDLLGDLLKFVRSGESVRLPETQDDDTYSVLKLNLRMGASSVQGSAASSSALLESRLLQVVQHAQKLRERLDDTSSRVLVTGDLNSGKSTLCNSLLRRRVLPVDQQPCTDVFCEVVDSALNDGVEEVHAVLHGHQKQYNRLDLDSGFRRFPLDKLDELVHLSDEYSLLKIYLKDPRPPQSSLLSNGIVDICLIDAPGLNVDQNQTSEVFGRQEEIDLVIFVVSAENHFTQSSKDFVSDTAREKSLVFIVVNNFDRIRDQQRCRNRVMSQVADLAPETHKGAGDFVHFVSSSPPPEGGDDPSPNPNHGPGSPDFDRLEASLRNFVLEKRNASKLAPARTYLLNVLGDLQHLASAGSAEAERDIKALESKLEDLGPAIDQTVAEYAHVNDQVDRDVERLTQALFSESFEYLTQVVSEIGEQPVVPWPGLAGVFSYAHETREALVLRMQQAVEHCEENARDVTATAVDAVKQLGILHVGEQPAFSKVFQKSAMFSRRRDNLGRHIEADFSVLDLFNFSGLLERPLPVLTSSKKALASSSPWGAISGAVTAFSVLGGAQVALGSHALKATITATSWTGLSPTKIIMPILAVGALALGIWTVHELPRTIPRTVARKIAFEVDELGYVRANAERIAAESRKVLRYPAQDVRAAFQTQLEARTRQRDEFVRHIRDAMRAADLFQGLQTRSSAVSQNVTACVLNDID